MQLRLDQLAGHLQKSLRPLYTLWGDEPLLAQEAGDAIRAAARAAGHTEREVHVVSGAHFNWSALLGAAQAMSLFADKQLIEIRIPTGKPGKDGSEALQRYCDALCDDVVTLIQLPRLDRQQQASAWFVALDAAGVTIRIDAIERKALPQWIAQRLALHCAVISTSRFKPSHGSSGQSGCFRPLTRPSQTCAACSSCASALSLNSGSTRSNNRSFTPQTRASRRASGSGLPAPSASLTRLSARMSSVSVQCTSTAASPSA